MRAGHGSKWCLQARAAMTELIDRLLQGDTIFTVMSPDTSVDQTAPDHIEGFLMTPCVAMERHVWGATDTLLIGHDAVAEAGGQPLQFFYTDMRNYFCTMVCNRFTTMASGPMVANFGTVARYKLHEFRAVADHRQVWESTSAASTDALVEAMSRGRRLKFALQILPEMWIVNRIVHAQQEADGSILLMGGANPIPQPMFNSKQTFDELPQLGQKEGYVASVDVLQAGLSISTGGWFVGQTGTTEPSKYLTLRVFEAL